jgi:hypothetical protein
MPARSGSNTSRALAWVHRMAERLAESKTPWAHGTVYRDRGHQARDPRVREVDYDTVDPLRRAWQREDFGDNDPTEYQQQAKAVRTLLGARTLAIFAGAEPIAFAGLDLGEDGAEIGGLYALPARSHNGAVSPPGPKPRLDFAFDRD